MTCPKCRGLMVSEVFGGFNPHDPLAFLGWRCFNCGTITDPLMESNRKEPPPSRKSGPSRRGKIPVASKGGHS